MKPDQQPQTVRTIVADPTAIGLLGLAIVTLVASSQKLGITEGTSLIIPWAIFLGAFAQLYASFGDSKLGNTYGAASVHKVLFFIFVMIDFLFVGLSLSTLAGSEFGTFLAGGSELTLSMLAFYGCAAAVLNAHFGRTVLPVGKPLIKR